MSRNAATAQKMVATDTMSPPSLAELVAVTAGSGPAAAPAGSRLAAAPAANKLAPTSGGSNPAAAPAGIKVAATPEGNRLASTSGATKLRQAGDGDPLSIQAAWVLACGRRF
jgi:hypothetical protein